MRVAVAHVNALRSWIKNRGIVRISVPTLMQLTGDVGLNRLNGLTGRRTQRQLPRFPRGAQGGIGDAERHSRRILDQRGGSDDSPGSRCNHHSCHPASRQQSKRFS